MRPVSLWIVAEAESDGGETEYGLDELSLARLREGRALLGELLAEYDGLVAAASAESDEPGFQRRGFEEMPARRAIEGWDPAEKFPSFSTEQRRCLLFACGEWVASHGGYFSMPGRCFNKLGKLPLDLVAGDIRLLAAVAEPRAPLHHSGDSADICKYVVKMTGRLLDRGAIGAAALADAVAHRIVSWHPMDYGDPDYVPIGAQDAIAELRDKALELAGRPPALPATEGAVGRDDAYGLAVIGWLGLAEDWPAGVAGFLAHCASAKPSKPGQRWVKVCGERLAEIADPDALLRGLLDLMLSTAPVSFLTGYGRFNVLIGYNERLVKGIVWAAGVLNPDWLPEVLRLVAVRCLRLCSGHVFAPTAVPGEKVPYACFWALARSGTDASLVSLARIGRATSNGSVLKNLERTLEQASAGRGISTASLLERLTPDHGIDASGTVSAETERGTWLIALDDREGAVVKGPETPEVPETVRAAAAEIRATVELITARLDDLFGGRREWHVEDFLDCYVRHPVTGWLACRLVWTFRSADGGTVFGIPDRDGETLRTAEGTVHLPAFSIVRLTHPVLLTPGELTRLRTLADELGIIQPVRQLWRETYQVSAAERETALYSERYAGHILRFNQAYGLARRRGWAGGFLSGAWDGGDTAVARRDYPQAGLRASWEIAELGHASSEVAVELCLTGQVAFSALADQVRAPVPLVDVPPEIFSEAMRDLDLVVSVTTVANDPLWFEDYHSYPDLDQYWQRVAQGGLDQLRTHRRALVARFFPDQAPGGKFELTASDLIVRGALATYRIDLATANVRMEPGGKWLSFDTRRPKEAALRHDIYYEPGLDDDEIFQRIIVRAAVLADDEQLAGRKLLKQIRG